MQYDEWAGLLAPDRSTGRTFPSLAAIEIADSQDSGYLRLSSPVTAAGPQRFAPFSLFFTPDRESGATPMSAAILTRAERLSTDEISCGRR